MGGDENPSSSFGHVPIPMGSPTESFESYMNAGSMMPTGLGESLAATMKLAGMETATVAIAGQAALADLKRGKDLVSPQKLNQLFPHVDKPFNEPMSLEAATYIADRAREKRELEDIVARGPQTAMFFPRLAAGMIPHIGDPVETVAAIAVGGLIGKGVQSIKGGVVAGRLASRLGLLERDAVKFALGQVGENAITEPFVMMSESAMRDEYTLGEATENVALGALGFSSLRYVAKKGASFIDRTSPTHAKAAEDLVTGQMAQGKKPDPSPVVADAVGGVEGAIPPGKMIAGQAEYRFERLNGEAIPDGRRFFVVVERNGSSILDSGPAAIDADILPGLVGATDHPGVANAYSSRLGEVGASRVVEVDLAGKKILDLEQPLPDALRTQVDSAIQKLGLGDLFTEADLKTMKARDVLEVMRDMAQRGADEVSALDSVKAAIRANAYDGVSYEGGRIEGVRNSPHNMVALFEESAPKDGRATYSPDHEAARHVADPRASGSATDASAVDPVSRDMAFMADWDRELQIAKEATEADVDIAKIKANNAARIEEVRLLQEQGLLSPDEIKVLDEIARVEKLAEEEATLVKAAAACMLRGI
jgi:hypothetical protein